MVRSDNWWSKFGRSVVTPFVESNKKTITLPGGEEIKAISFGTSSGGYDLTLSKDRCTVLDSFDTREIDPKNFDSSNHLRDLEYTQTFDGDYFLIPPKSYFLAVTCETITIPSDKIGIVLGKSTYVRCGLIHCMTPLEPGWSGRLVLEAYNSTNSPLRIYTDEGFVQLLLLDLDQRAAVSYSDRSGKYMHQTGVTPAIV